MKTPTTKITMLLVAVLAFAASFSQNSFTGSTSVIKGMVKFNVNTSYGTIRAFFPSHLKESNIISGRIIADPAGNNEKQKLKALEEIRKLVFKFGNESSSTLLPLSFAGEDKELVALYEMELKSLLEPYNFSVTGSKGTPVKLLHPGSIMSQGDIDFSVCFPECEFFSAMIIASFVLKFYR